MITLRADELIVDNFAGGGGATTGIEMALGRHVDIAINHDPEAVAMHAANHPHTRHYCQSVWKADPREVCKGPDGKCRPVGLAWFSPDCKHFSKAKGGKPVEKGIRDLAWVVVHWAKWVKPRVIILENVEEFRDWGPLIMVEGGKLVPCPLRKGLTFKRWKRQLVKLGYVVEDREMRACDYGAPTIRKRLFVVARCDGEPIVWPAATHAKGGADGLPAWRSAAECIDWSIPCPSIFTRKKPLAEATLRRIARGVMRYVVNSASPFIIRTDQSSATRAGVHSIEDPVRTITAAGGLAMIAPSLIPITHHGDDRCHDVGDPLRTITTAARGEFALAAAHITKFRAGATGSDLAEPMPTVTANSFIKRPGGAPPLGLVTAFLEQANTGLVGHDAREPLSTIVGKGCTQRLVAASLVQTGYGEREGQAPRALDIEAPLGTVVGGGVKHGLVAASLTKFKGTAKDGQPVDEPLHTIQAGGTHHGLVAAFLQKYYGTGGQDASLEDPMHTLTAKARMGLVTVEINGESWAIVDIGMRMLVEAELYRAQGFPRTYIIRPILDGKPLTKTASIRMAGNSVSPPNAAAIVRANLGGGGASETVAA